MRFYLAGPASNKRNANSALVHRSLESSQRPAGIEYAVESGRGAIVGAEKDDGFLIDSEALEQIEQFSDVPVDHCIHSRDHFCVVRPIPVFVDFPGGLVFGYLVFAVRRRPGGIAEEGPVLVLADKSQCLLEDSVMRVALHTAGRTGHRNPFAVAPQVLGPVIVGVDLVIVSEEFVEALPFGHTGRTDVSEAPLSEAAGGIACFLEDLGDGNILVTQRYSAGIAADAGMAHMQSRHQDAAGRRTDGAAGVGIGETDSFFGHLVDVGRSYLPAAVAAQIGPAHIVHDNKDDVGPFGRCCAGVFAGHAEAPVCRQGCEARTYCLEKVSPFHRLSSPDGTFLLCLFSFSGSYRRCGVRVVARVFLGGHRRVEPLSPGKQHVVQLPGFPGQGTGQVV